MTPRLRRILFMAGLGLVVALGLIWAFRPMPVAVEVARAVRGPLTVTADEEARTRVKESFVVSAPVAGRLRRVKVDAGDPVTAGETVLATLTPTIPSFLDARARAQAEAGVKAAEAARDLAAAEVERAKAQAVFAQSEHERIGRLITTDAASRRALEAAAMDLRVARAAVATAEAGLRLREYELETAKAQLIEAGSEPDGGTCCIAVRAPAGGLVLRVLQESEAVVAAGTPLVELGDPSDIEIVADMLSTDAVKIAPGAEVLIERWGGEPLTGVVRRVEPYGFTKVSALGVDEQRVPVVIDLTAPRQSYGTLAHGFRVEVRVVLWKGRDILKVPAGALFRQDGTWHVFAVREGRAVLTPVEAGASDGLETQVVSGLAEGDEVVVHPSDKVADGARVERR